MSGMSCGEKTGKLEKIKQTRVTARGTGWRLARPRSSDCRAG